MMPFILALIAALAYGQQLPPQPVYTAEVEVSIVGDAAKSFKAGEFVELRGVGKSSPTCKVDQVVGNSLKLRCLWGLAILNGRK